MRTAAMAPLMVAGLAVATRRRRPAPRRQLLQARLKALSFGPIRASRSITQLSLCRLQERPRAMKSPKP